MSALILLGASLIPLFLIAALMRGGLRGRRERADLERLKKDFE
jgi:hypothetical protein